jgi:hypothetical protein
MYLHGAFMNETLYILFGKRDCLRTRISRFNRWRDRLDLWLTERKISRIEGSYGGHKVEINRRMKKIID